MTSVFRDFSCDFVDAPSRAETRSTKSHEPTRKIRLLTAHCLLLTDSYLNRPFTDGEGQPRAAAAGASPHRAWPDAISLARLEAGEQVLDLTRSQDFSIDIAVEAGHEANIEIAAGQLNVSPKAMPGAGGNRKVYRALLNDH